MNGSIPGLSLIPTTSSSISPPVTTDSGASAKASLSTTASRVDKTQTFTHALQHSRAHRQKALATEQGKSGRNSHGEETTRKQLPGTKKKQADDGKHTPGIIPDLPLQLLLNPPFSLHISQSPLNERSLTTHSVRDKASRSAGTIQWMNESEWVKFTNSKLSTHRIASLPALSDGFTNALAKTVLGSGKPNLNQELQFLSVTALPFHLSANSISHTGSPMAQANIPVAVQNSGFPSAVGYYVSGMLDNQLKVVQLHLNPPNLGPLQVQVKVDGQHTEVTLQVQHAVVRDALAAGLPQLLELLSQNGQQINVQLQYHPGGSQGQSGQGNHSPPRRWGTHASGHSSSGFSISSESMVLPGVSRWYVDPLNTIDAYV